MINISNCSITLYLASMHYLLLAKFINQRTYQGKIVFNMLYTKIYIIQCNHCNATLKIKLSANIFMNSNKYDDTFTANTELICSLFSLSRIGGRVTFT